MNTYWISFATDRGFRGVVIVDADDEMRAIHRVNELNLNPGGQVAFIQCPPGDEEVEKLGRDRLIREDELLDDGYAKLKDLVDVSEF